VATLERHGLEPVEAEFALPRLFELLFFLFEGADLGFQAPNHFSHVEHVHVGPAPWFFSGARVLAVPDATKLDHIVLNDSRLI
jgi:hypothetical protein